MKKNIQYSVGTLFICASLLVLNGCSTFNSFSASKESSDAKKTPVDQLKASTVTIAYDTKQVTYSGAYVIDGKEVTIDGGTYKSTIANQNVFLVVNGGTLNIKNASIKKSGTLTSTGLNSSSDDYVDYGINASILVLGEGSSANLNNCTFESSSNYGSPLFATNNASIEVKKSEIVCDGEYTPAIQIKNNASMKITNSDITTKQTDSPALLNESGSVQMEGGVIHTKKKNSPCFLTSSQTSLKNTRATANKSQALVLKSNSNVSIKKCNLNGKKNSAISLYQEEYNSDSNCILSIYKSTIQNESNGPLFSLSNTNANIEMENCTLKNSTTTLIKTSANKDKVNLNFNANTQNLSGDIISDAKSSVTLNLDNSISNGNHEGNVTLTKQQ